MRASWRATWTAIWVMAVKDLRLMYSDKVGFFFIWFYPVLFAVFFGYVMSTTMGGDGGKGMGAVPVALVDEDQSEGSKKFISRLKKEESLSLEDTSTRAEGIQKVRGAVKPVCLVIPEGYGEAARNVFGGTPPELELITDPARPMEAGIGEGLVTSVAFAGIQDMFSDPTMMLDQLGSARDSVLNADDITEEDRRVYLEFLDDIESFFLSSGFFGEAGGNGESSAEGEPSAPDSSDGRNGWKPVRIRKTSVADLPASGEASADAKPKSKLSSYAIALPQAIAWGVMACAATFALSLVTERTRGTLPRLEVAPIRRWQILAGKALSCAIATATVMVGMLLLGWVALGVYPVSPLLLIPAIVCIAVAVVGIMMLMSVLGRSEAAVGGISWAVLVVMAMFGGGMIPLAAMDGVLAQLSHISIFRWTILALEGAVWRDYSLIEMFTPCGILLAIGVGGFIVGSVVYSRRS